MWNMFSKIYFLVFTIIVFIEEIYGSSTPVSLDQYLQPNDVGRDTSYDALPDDSVRCSRNCSEHPEKRICYYQFVLEQYNVMGPACDNCSLGVTEDCFKPQCVPGDGVEKTVLVYNRMFMGPSIQVCENDKIIVDVSNFMVARLATVHWHGQLQRNSPFMDGAAYITQCPINEGAKFRYNFHAQTSGTHFYHSHSGLQEFEGLSGILIVRKSDHLDPNRHLYDFDLYSHAIHVSDWMHVMADNKYPGANRDDSLITFKADSYLVNGLGIYKSSTSTKYTTTPVATFAVKKGFRYRFRIVGAGSHVCTARIAFEKHSMVLVAADGYDVRPVTVGSIWVNPGDRFDVIINANQTARNYQIYIQGTDLCQTAMQYAFLQYEGSAHQKLEYLKDPDSLFTAFPYPNLNNVRSGCVLDDSSVCMDELRSYEAAPSAILKPEPDIRFIQSLGRHEFSYQELYRTNTYHRHNIIVSGPTITTPLGAGKITTSTIDNKTNMLPSYTIYKVAPSPDILCPDTCEKFCECLNYVKLELNSVVEIVFTDEVSNDKYAVDHPMHLHGNHFWVLRQGSKSERTNEGNNFYLNTVINNASCFGPSCTDRPIRRDVVSVPSGGFAVIRFLADNPGIFHSTAKVRFAQLKKASCSFHFNIMIQFMIQC